MFGLTMVTSYLGWSGLLWLGELVIGSTIMYGERSEIGEPMVVRWACVKKLATANMGEWG